MRKIVLAMSMTLLLGAADDLPAPDASALPHTMQAAEAGLADVEKEKLASGEAQDTLKQARALLEQARKDADQGKSREAAMLVERVPLLGRLARLQDEAAKAERRAEASEKGLLETTERARIAKRALENAIEQLDAGPATLAAPEVPVPPPSTPEKPKLEPEDKAPEDKAEN